MKKQAIPRTQKPDRRSVRRSKTQILLFRIFLRIVIISLFIFMLFMIKSGIVSVFFTSNPHFKLQNVKIEIVKGILTEGDIRRKFDFEIGNSNLLYIQPQKIREEILADTLVQEVEVRRILPGELNLTVYGRTPVAQLIRSGGRLIDTEAIILQSSTKRELVQLPIITGIPGIGSYQPGQKLENLMILKILEFLELKAVVTNGSWLDIHLIQLNDNYNEYRVYLNENKECYIRNGALLILPVEDMTDGMARALTILEQRMKAKQPTSYINVTYKKKVPVRP